MQMNQKNRYQRGGSSAGVGGLRNNSLRSRLRRAWQGVVNRAVKLGPFPTFMLALLIALLPTWYGYKEFVTPNVESNEAWLSAVVKKEAENESNREIEKSEPQFRKEFKKVVQLYNDAQPLLPSDAEVANVLAQVQEAAVRNGVTLSGLNAIKEGIKSPSSDKLYEREFPALVTGTHPQVVRFFYDVSRMPRIILIRDFAVTSLRQKVSVSFTLMSYNSPPPAEVPELPKDIAALNEQKNK